MRLSPWISVDHCATRVIEGSDPELLQNRIAFIEKSGRVRTAPFEAFDGDCDKWRYVCHGSSECGSDMDTRREVDAELLRMGHELT